jgi:hypothetical protein
MVEKKHKRTLFEALKEKISPKEELEKSTPATQAIIDQLKLEAQKAKLEVDIAKANAQKETLNAEIKNKKSGRLAKIWKAFKEHELSQNDRITSNWKNDKDKYKGLLS